MKRKPKVKNKTSEHPQKIKLNDDKETKNTQKKQTKTIILTIHKDPSPEAMIPSWRQRFPFGWPLRSAAGGRTWTLARLSAASTFAPVPGETS